MRRTAFYLLSDDDALCTRLCSAANEPPRRLAGHADLAPLAGGTVVLVDVANPGLPSLQAPFWRAQCERLKIGFLSPAPNDNEGLLALEAGAHAYCHSYAAEHSMQQMLDVIASGELWVGRSLMARLLKGVRLGAATSSKTWHAPLTEREREVAAMASMGDSNLTIANALGITERTVKSHLTTIFDKLDVSDRLQLALRIHGIR